MNSHSNPLFLNSGSTCRLNCSISFFKILSAAVMFVPRSEVKRRTPGRLALKRTMALIREAASNLYTSSLCTDLVVRHVKITVQTLCVALPFILHGKGPIKSSPVSSKGGVGETLFESKVAIRCSIGFLYAFWQGIHFVTIERTSWRPCRIHVRWRNSVSVCLAPQ